MRSFKDNGPSSLFEDRGDEGLRYVGLGDDVDRGEDGVREDEGNDDRGTDGVKKGVREDDGERDEDAVRGDDGDFLEDSGVLRGDTEREGPP